MKRFLVCICCLCAVGCPPNEVLEADFSATPTTGEAPLTVTFTDASTAGSADLSAWTWEFGDGTVSEEQNPTHTYAGPGIYVVSLEILDTDGETDILSEIDYITVSEAPLSIITNRLSGSAPLSIVFEQSVSAELATIDSRVWDFGDPESAEITATDERVLHEYLDPGFYTASLTVETMTGESFSTAVEIAVFENDGTIISDDTVVVELELALGFMEMTEDTLIFQYDGSNPIPFEVGSIVVGTEDGGYLREVTAVTEELGIVILTTQQASLADVVVEGEFGFEGEFTTEDFIKAGFKAVDEKSITLIDLSGTAIIEEDFIELTLETGELSIDPMFSFDAEYSLLAGLISLRSSVTSMEAILDGPITGGLVFFAKAGGEINLETDAQIGPTLSKPFRFFVGQVPVVGAAELTLEIAATVDIVAETEFRAGFELSIPAHLAIKYQRDAIPAWTTTAEFPIEVTPIVPDPDTDVQVTLRVSLGPKLTIKFYEFIAPSLAVEPYLEGNVTIAPAPTIATVDAGVDATLAFQVGIFAADDDEEDNLLIDQKLPIKGPTKELFRFTSSDMDIDATFVNLTEADKSVVINVNNAAPELPETLFDKAPTVDLFEPLAWIAIPSDTRIKVNPSSHFGDGSQIGDNREVTISISQADLEELSGQTLSVDFINTQDFLFRDDISLPVGIGDVGTPFEVAFGSWERSPDDANNTDRFVLNSDLTFTWLNGFVTDDGFFSNWNISGTLRVEEPVEGGWTMYYVGISDCNSGQPDFNNPCFTGRVDVLPGRRLTQETAFTPANPDLPGGLEVDRLGFDGFPGDGIKFYFRESK